LSDHLKDLKGVNGELCDEKLGSLYGLVNSIQFLIREETMYLLLEMDNASQAVIHFIINQLRSNVYRIRPKHCSSITLPFIKPEQGRHLFLSELEHANLLPYKLQRTGDFFFIQDSISLADHNAYRDQSRNEAQVYSEYLNSFGISFSDKSEHYPPRSHKPSYWVLIVPERQSTSIYVFSRDVDGVDRSYVTNLVKETIHKVYIRVNRILLLKDLIDTHSCR
jgi:hypothetical protein